MDIKIAFDIGISDLITCNHFYESWVDLFQEKAQEKTKVDLDHLQIVDYNIIGHTDSHITIEIYGTIDDIYGD